jgi:general secretion pathway protein A
LKPLLEIIGDIFAGKISMYEKYYGLKEKPFSIVPNPSYLYRSDRHRNALTYLEYGLMENVGFILLTGEVGTGKTTLVRYILKEFTSGMEVAVVFNTNVSAEQFIDLVLRAFELESTTQSKAESIEIFYRFLIKQFAENKRVLLIIDEAQNLSDEALEEIRMLSNLQSDNEMLLHVMLVGQPELKAKLKQPDHFSFSQRIAVNYFLSPLDKDEIEAYITFRLNIAGRERNLFTAEAIKKIFEASNGIPRTINLLCDAAMVYGFGYDMDLIDAPVIEQVLSDKGDMGITDNNVNGDTDPPPITINGQNNGLVERLIKIEENMRELQMKMDWYSEEIMQRSVSSSNETLLKLKKLLVAERKKSDKVQIENKILERRIVELEEALRDDISALDTIAKGKNIKAQLQHWLEKE